MDWFKYQRTLIDNPKTKKLARLLDMQPVHVIGHLLSLWSWAIDYAQDGDLSPFCAEDIAEAARYGGDAEKLLDALINCGMRGGGFIDRTEDGMCFHDWEENIGAEFEKRAKDAERKREARAKEKQMKANIEDRPMPVRRTSEDRPMPVRRERRGEEREERKGDTLPPPPLSEGDSGKVTLHEVIGMWNDKLVPLGFPETAKATPRRDKAFRARVAERAERREAEWWRDRIAQLADSEFMRQSAQERRGWLNFDWLLKEDNLVKVYEGKYNGQTKTKTEPKTIEDYNRIINEATTYEEKRAAYYASLNCGR